MTSAPDTPSTVDPDAVDTDLDLEIRDGKIHAPVDQLSPWEENPREVSETDLERLRTQLTDLGQYKPLIVAVDTPVVDDGTVVGGNMRIEALTQLEWDTAWVSLVSPATHDELVELALSDNDRAGKYDEDQMTNVLDRTEDIDVSKFKVDFYKPQDIAQNMARSMDPDDLLAKAGYDGGDGDGDGDGDSGSGDPVDRSLENLGSSDPTAMVQLIMAQGEKDVFTDQVQTLKLEYDVHTTTDVVQEAIKREYQRISDDYPDAPSAKSREEADD